jgi:hypothetical protein
MDLGSSRAGPVWPTRIEVPLPVFLSSAGRIVRQFGDRDGSGAMVFGLETEAGRFVVKHGAGRTAGSLESAVRLHARVSHPSIAAVLHAFDTPDGRALIEQWAPGEVLVDDFDEAVSDRDDPASPYQRFLRLPAAEIAEAVRQVLHAHVTVVGAGFVAVDLHDACLVYDFDDGHLTLIDLDEYRPGPYVLAADRQYGSSR